MARSRRARGRKQLSLQLKERNWGGARKGAGRKPKGPRPLGDKRAVPHHVRPHLDRRHPVHITIRMMRHVWSLRSQRSFHVIGKALRGLQDIGVRPTHYSVQGNHLHLILEVENRAHLTHAMRSFTSRLAKGLNAVMRRRGRVIADRYHSVPLRTPTQTRNTIRYVLSNSRKHAVERGEPIHHTYSDRYAAGPPDHVPPEMHLNPSPLLIEPRTWLLRVGWLRSRGQV